MTFLRTIVIGEPSPIRLNEIITGLQNCGLEIRKIEKKGKVRKYAHRQI